VAAGSALHSRTACMGAAAVRGALCAWAGRGRALWTPLYARVSLLGGAWSPGGQIPPPPLAGSRDPCAPARRTRSLPGAGVPIREWQMNSLTFAFRQKTAAIQNTKKHKNTDPRACEALARSKAAARS